MESPLPRSRMDRDHEPRDRSADLRSGANPVAFPNEPGRRPAFRVSRLMEREHLPPGACVVLVHQIEFR